MLRSIPSEVVKRDAVAIHGICDPRLLLLLPLLLFDDHVLHGADPLELLLEQELVHLLLKLFFNLSL
jgi:hypothetical protein